MQFLAVDFYQTGARRITGAISPSSGTEGDNQKTIRVNDPLSFEGITFYQSSYGRLPGTVTLEIKRKDGSPWRGVRPLRAAGLFRAPASISWSSITVSIFTCTTVPRPAPSTCERPQTGCPASRDMGFQKKGPKSILRIVHIRGQRSNTEEIHRAAGQQRPRRLGGVDRAPSCSCSHHDGLFMSHKKLWIRIGKDKKDRVEVTACGITNKNKHAFAAELKRLTDSFQGGFCMTNSLLFGVSIFVYFFSMVLYVSYLAFRSEGLGKGGDEHTARRRRHRDGSDPAKVV